MQGFSIDQTQLGPIARREVPVAQFVPYTHHVDPHTVATKSGYLLQVIQIDGFPFETASAPEIDYRKHIRNALWRSLSSSRFAVYHHLIRNEIHPNSDPEGTFSGFAKELDERWHSQLFKNRLFINHQYLTVIRRPLQGTVGLVESLGKLFSSKANRGAVDNDRDDNLKELYKATDTLLSTLSNYGAKRLATRETPSGLFLRSAFFFSNAHQSGDATCTSRSHAARPVPPE